MERWKEVYGFDVLYEVSDRGNVRTKYDAEAGYTPEYREVLPCDNGNGYQRFNWRKKGKQTTVYLHRLVALYFVDNPNGYTEVNHRDENKKNNSADNLEWCTHTQNCGYGTRNARAGIAQRIPVKCNEMNLTFESARDAAEWANVVPSAIGNCLKGRTKTSGGFTWSYC